MVKGAYQVKKSYGEKAFNLINVLFMIVLILAFFIPYWVIFAASFTDELTLLKSGYMIIPQKLSLSAYKFIFLNDTVIFKALGNSIFITIIGTILAVIITSMFAYPLSRKYLPGRKWVMIYVMITMLFSGGLIPFYLVVKSLGLHDSLWAVIIPLMVSAWNMILIRNFFMAVPNSLEESAWIDGANDLIIFLKIMLPVSKPILATITLFYAVAYWNDWYLALLFIRERTKMPVQLLIRELLSNFNQILAQTGVMTQREAIVPQESTKMASIVVASLPIILVYPFLQKYFIKGIMVGSIKG